MSKALVTGAAGGIGRAIAKRLCRDGFRVVIHYHHSESAAAELCSLINHEFGEQRAEIFCADVSDLGQTEAMFRAVGEIDLLVNNAGVAQQKLFTQLTEEDWQRMIGVDLTGVFHCCRLALPGMIHRKSGRIINVSSMWGQVGASCEVHYSAAKAGVIGLTKALAKEVGPSGITVNCIAPGVIDTPMNSQLDAETIHELEEETPLCRIGTPEDIAAAVSFLASEEAGFITGQILGVNGGFVI